MNVARLKKKGWSNSEIEHVLKVFTVAARHKGKRRMEKVAFWVLIALLTSGMIGAALMLLPFIVFSILAYTIPIVFLLGTCMGLFLVHAVHDLKMEHKHQHVGLVVLVLTTVVLVSFSLHVLQARFGETHTFAVALPLVLGILVPYFVHWRLTHETH
ncbi:MAG: hypothetical protein OXR66_09215 [Candidatus Woesearchaeota archaeon]|nr:hypothetical protein [Candidatus Woesearchaeota archaeon]